MRFHRGEAVASPFADAAALRAHYRAISDRKHARPATPIKLILEPRQEPETVCNIEPNPPSRIMLSSIMNAVCDHFKVPADVIAGPRRSRYIMGPRFVFCWLANRHTGHSLVRIGRHINRDHSTVVNAISVVNSDLAFNMPDIVAIEKVLGLK